MAEREITEAERKTALGVGCMAHIVQDGLTATIFVFLPILAQTFGLSYAQVGLFKGLKSLSQAVLEMYSGFFTERLGECRTLIFGLLVAGAGYGLLTIAPGAAVVMLSLLIIGVGTAFQHAPASALIISAYPVELRRGPLGLYNSSGDIGKLVFTGCFSLAIGAGIAWQGLSLLFGIVAVIAALAIAIVARAFIARSDSKPEAPAGEEAPASGEAPSGWGILNWQLFGMLLAGVFLDTIVQTSVLVFIAFFMLAKGLSLALATAATVVVLIGGVFGKAGCGFLADRIGVRTAFAIIQMLTAVGLVCVAYAPAWLAFLLLLPLGTVVQGSTSITYGFAADLIHPRRMARGYALLYSAASFSSAAGPYICGVIADRYGIQAAFIVMAAASLAAVPPIALLRQSKVPSTASAKP